MMDLYYFIVLAFVVAAAVAFQPAQVSAEGMMKHGLLRAGITAKIQGRVSKKRNTRRFKAHYGSTPEVCVALWNALQTTSIRNARIRPLRMNLDWSLTAVHFLKTYKTEDELEAFTKESDLKLTREWPTAFDTDLRNTPNVSML
jgi:hypothetical protein